MAWNTIYRKQHMFNNICEEHNRTSFLCSASGSGGGEVIQIDARVRGAIGGQCVIDAGFSDTRGACLEADPIKAHTKIPVG